VGAARRMTTVMAMDAQPYTDARRADRQFEEAQMLREINKARVAFTAAGSARTHSRCTAPTDAANAAANATIASGNWGCGAFGACDAKLTIGLASVSPASVRPGPSAEHLLRRSSSLLSSTRDGELCLCLGDSPSAGCPHGLCAFSHQPCVHLQWREGWRKWDTNEAISIALHGGVLFPRLA
jgi:hypothetical protein